MKIKKCNKKWFYISLFVSIGIIGTTIYDLVSSEFTWIEIILDILMVIVMLNTTTQYIEFKK